MTRPLFQLGTFQFDLPNGVPQTLDRTANFRWEEQGRLLRDPAQQFIGPGSQTITLDGVLYPGFSGRQSTMEDLRSIAREGQPLMLTDGLGTVYGKWAITSLREGKANFAAGGGARQISFSISLVFYGEDNPGLAASPLSVAPSSLTAQLASAATTDITFADPGSAFQALDWSQATQWQGLTQQATGAGFSLGQLAGIASTGIDIANAAARGDYVNTALRIFGLFGFDATTAGGWAQVGINAAQLAQSYLDGNGADGMGVALEVAASVGGQALLAAGAIQPEDSSSINTLLKSAATLSTLLEVDPQITSAVRNSVVVP